jgi:hypothetical protein
MVFTALAAREFLGHVSVPRTHLPSVDLNFASRGPGTLPPDTRVNLIYMCQLDPVEIDVLPRSGQRPCSYIALIDREVVAVSCSANGGQVTLSTRTSGSPPKLAPGSEAAASPTGRHPLVLINHRLPPQHPSLARREQDGCGDVSLRT